MEPPFKSYPFIYFSDPAPNNKIKYFLTPLFSVISTSPHDN